MKKENVCFVLYKPAVPGNIGASARALKTMGFNQLRLIEPADHLSDEARMLAHGANDILEESLIFPSFEKATEDLDFIIASTAKKRTAKVDYLPASSLSEFIRKKGSTIRNLGIVFGTEESGLPNTFIQQANLAVSIPMAASYPSLNLSQSVMILAYELSQLKHTIARPKDKIPGTASWREFQERSTKILTELDIKPGTPLYHRIMERLSYLKESDANLAHSISSRIDSILNDS